MAEAKKTYYSIAVIAKVLELSESRVFQLTRAGVIPKAARGQYEIIPAVQGYIRYLRNLTQAGGEPNSAEEIVKDRARLIKAQAEALEMDNAITRGEYLPKKMVRSWIQRMVLACRAKLIALPTKTAPRVVGCSSVAEIEALLTKGIHEALDELACSEISERDGDDPGTDPGRDGVVPTPSDADGQRVGRQVPMPV